jgi:hypothetical protein
MFSRLGAAKADLTYSKAKISPLAASPLPEARNFRTNAAGKKRANHDSIDSTTQQLHYLFIALLLACFVIIKNGAKEKQPNRLDLPVAL